MFQVAQWLGEPDPYFWQDYTKVVNVNNALQEMASIAGGLTKFENVQLQNIVSSTPAPGTIITLQEAALDVEVDCVKSCKYYSGQEFVLSYRSWKDIQTGSSTGSIPQFYYLKTDTKELTPMSTANSNITSVPLGPNMPGGTTYRTVIGAWPVPPGPALLQVWYSYFHPFVQNPTDPIEIPRRFLRGLACGAASYCIENEKAAAESDRWTAIFKAYCEDFRIYMSRQKQSDNPPSYGPSFAPWRQNASSSVVLIDPYPMGP